MVVGARFRKIWVPPGRGFLASTFPRPERAHSKKDETMSKNKNRKKTDTDPVTGEVTSDDGFVMLGGGVGKEMAIGEVVVGKFEGVVRSMPGRRKGSTVDFYGVGGRPLLGSTVLASRIEDGIKAGKLAIGDIVRITRLEDGEKKKGQNAPKIYTVEVKRGN